MEIPPLPLVRAYNKMSNCFNFVLIENTLQGIYYVRFGERQIVVDHDGVMHAFKDELIRHGGTDELFYRHVSQRGGGFVDGIVIPGHPTYTAVSGKRCVLYGRSKHFGRADMNLVEKVLLESKFFNSVQIRD